MLQFSELRVKYSSQCSLRLIEYSSQCSLRLTAGVFIREEFIFKDVEAVTQGYQSVLLTVGFIICGREKLK